jgi:hypothetical protein
MKMLNCCNTKYGDRRSVECHYAKCHCTECREVKFYYAECRLTESHSDQYLDA